MFLDVETRAMPRVIAERIDAGTRSVGEGARLLSEHRSSPRRPDGPQVRMPAGLALAEGERDRRHLRVGARLTTLPPGGMGGATATPLAAGLSLLRNAVPAGVHAPERAFDSGDFLAELAPRCDPPALPDEVVIVEEAAT